MGGLFQRHGRKLFWVGVIAYFVMFTDVPVTKIASWGVMGILGLLALMLFRQDSMLYHPVVGTYCCGHNAALGLAYDACGATLTAAVVLCLRQTRACRASRRRT